MGLNQLTVKAAVELAAVSLRRQGREVRGRGLLAKEWGFPGGSWDGQRDRSGGWRLVEEEGWSLCQAAELGGCDTG